MTNPLSNGNNINSYVASTFGKEENDLMTTFYLQFHDARSNFLYNIRPRLDRSYKLYVGYIGDRQMQIKKWQSNVFVPYIQSVVETLMPRILDARPDFTVQGRNEESQQKAEKQQQLGDYTWEVSKMDSTMEDMVRSALIYGTGFLQVYWKKDVRKLKYLKTKDLLEKKYKYETREKVYYDAPYCEWVDNYSLWYDWHNTNRSSKQYWFKRYVLTAPEIKRKYPGADKKRLELALKNAGGDLNDYASLRINTKTTQDLITRSASTLYGPLRNQGGDKYNTFGDPALKMYEVIEWYRPFEDEFSVHVGGSYVPILKGASIPFPYDFKESPFIETPYLKLPGEFEGIGLPMILENPQIMLNTIKNQRLDAATLSIHKMWIVNPLANINKDQLVTRPFGIIYSTDPNGVREVQFSDIKASAYKEEDLLKSDMRYSSGVDDFSMGASSGSSSATEVRHLRESTLERVRLFVNHLGNSLSDVMRYWMDMSRQFYTKPMVIRILGDDGKLTFPLIEKDDLCGMFDYKASVLPSIAGQNDVKKKQDMDLFQLLITLPFVDQRKLTSKVLMDWNWSLDSISKTAEEENAMGMDQGNGEEVPQEGQDMQGMEMDPTQMGMSADGSMPAESTAPSLTNINSSTLGNALSMLRKSGEQPGFSQANTPINLLNSKAQPPTVKGVGGTGGIRNKTTNLRGLNRKVGGGKVNTNLNMSGKTSVESSLLNRVNNIQS